MHAPLWCAKHRKGFVSYVVDYDGKPRRSRACPDCLAEFREIRKLIPRKKPLYHGLKTSAG